MVEQFISEVADETQKSILEHNLKLFKSEISEEQPKKSVLKTCLSTMKLVATSIATIPDLKAGLDIIADLIGISI